MADAVDVANDYIDTEVNRALKGRRDAPKKIGPLLCKVCEVDMPEPRRQLGFDLCIDCATDAEKRQSLFA